MGVPTLEIIDFVDGLRTVDVSGARGELAVDMVEFKVLLGRLGVRFHTREGKQWRPTRIIAWPGCTVDTGGGVFRIEDKIVTQGTSVRRELFGLQPDSTTAARGVLSPVSLNFDQWVAPGNFRHLCDG